MAHVDGACYCGCRGPTTPTNGAKQAPQAYERWTAAEEATLRRLFSHGWSVSRLAEALGRHPGGIRARLRRLELID